MVTARRAAPLALGVALAAAAALVPACQRDVGGGFLVPFSPPGEPVSEDEFEVLGIRFSRPPEVAELTVDHERRPVLLATPSGWTWRGRLPAEPRLAVGVHPLPEALARSRGFEARIALRHEGERQVLKTVTIGPSDRTPWHDLTVDLGPWAGEPVTLELSAAFAGLGGEDGERTVAWGPVSLSGESPRSDRRPNVVLIVVDSLRADRLGTYGAERWTSPEIDRRLAARGAVLEDAYAQAPWTLPSAISYLTGRRPGELVRGGLDEMAVPEGVPTLAERLRDAGYRTAAFVANPALHAGIGFARGFDTFYLAPPERGSPALRGDSVNRRVLPWLAAHGGRPYFLYLHYLEPHDPYDNPEIVDGRSPFLPDYEGPIRGDMVHGLYTGQVELADPEADVDQLRALYDSEVHYVDSLVGELLGGFGREDFRRTLIVLTSDHGEELYEHGGWKHGHTLYNEQIRVPLVLRWDGRIPEGRRLAGSVRLIDLAPTVLAAAELEIPSDLDGIDLLPALAGIETLPRQPAMAEHLSFGPLRAAAVLDEWKLILFNATEPFTPADPLEEATWPVDRDRLERVELYDLARDPGETVNLAEAEPAQVEQLEPVIHGQLDAELPGLRVMLDAVDPGRRLAGRIVLERPPETWLPYFLAEGDVVGLSGRELTFDLVADRVQKGVRVLGDAGGIEALELSLDGAPVATRRVLVGRGDPYRGGSLPAERLVSADWPFRVSVPVSPVLRVWRPPAAVEERMRAPAVAAGEAEETRRRLRALGYLR